MSIKKCLTFSFVFVITFLIIFSQSAVPQELSVKAWEEPLVIPTYKLDPPILLPMFYDGRNYQGARGPVYPSPWYDALTDNLVNVSYKGVFLENKYIKICVTPEIDGRIFYAIDKSNNYDLFYRQHVIKYSRIGMLGAWISGGVEWNVPHHHRPSTNAMIDNVIKDNPDGSKTIWVGEIESRHRMRWLIGLTLYPDKSYIEATFKLMNRTPYVNSFLFFANPAVHVDSSYQVIFPPGTQYVTQHAKSEFSEWPVSQSTYGGHLYDNVDISWWKNLPVPVSFFCWNYEADYFAGYNHGKDAGVAYVANRYIAPGKKFFSFGNGDQGRMWDKVLTDTDGPYLELMAGAYSDNQPDYSWNQPYEVKTVKQYWYPIKKLGGMKYANLEGALNLEVTPNSKAIIKVNSTSFQSGARIVLKLNDEIVFEQSTDISPENPFGKEVSIPAGTREEDLKISLYASSGKELLNYQPVKKALAPRPEPVIPPPAPKDIKTNEELYLAGLRLDQFYNTKLDPYAYYEEALRRDPGDYRVNTQLGILYIKRGMFQEAEEKLKKAVERVTKNYTSPKDGEALYYLGIALKMQNKFDAAYDALYKATWSLAWHSAAYFALAEIDCRRGDFLNALDRLNRSISTNILNTEALNLKAVVLRKLGRFDEAEKQVAIVNSIDPLDDWSQNELYLLKSREGLNREEAVKDIGSLKTKMRDDNQSYLELAVDYGNCGLWDEAIEVLSRLDVSQGKKGSTYPEIYYYLGYFLEKKGDRERSLKYYQLAGKMPADYCFPSRLESIEVLKSAMQSNPSDARAPYYLGNLFYDNQPENAIKEWEKSRDLDGTFSIVHRNLGFAYTRIEENIPKAIASYEKAISCDESDARLLYELDVLYEMGGISPEKRLALMEKYSTAIQKRDDSLYRNIILFVLMGQYDKAIEIMHSRHFHLFAEEGGIIHNVYVDAHLLRGREEYKAGKYREALKDYQSAFEYPDNLEAGRPEQDERFCQIFYLIGTAYEALGDISNANEYYQKATSVKAGQSEFSYYKALACLKLNQLNTAYLLFDELMKAGKEQLTAGTRQDFFAKFGERQAKSVPIANAHFLIGLGCLGKGNKKEAKVEFEKALEFKIDHLGAKTHLAELK